MMAAAVLLAASCAEAEEEKNVREDQAPGEELVQKTFKCSSEATKSTLGEENKVLFSNGEKILVFDEYDTHEFEVKGSGNQVEITGNLQSGTDRFFALTPYSHGCFFDSDEDFNHIAEMTLPQSQAASKGTFADGINIAAAVSGTEDKFSFKNLLSFAKLTLSSGQLGGKTVKAVELSSSYPLAGDVVVTFGSEIKAAGGDNTVNYVEISKEGGMADGDYYLTLLPNPGGEVTISFTATDGSVATKTATLKEFKAGVIKNLGSVKGLQWKEPDYVLVESAPSDWFGDYVIVYAEDNANGTGRLFAGKSISGNYGAYENVSISDKRISLADDSRYKVTIAKASDGYSIEYTATGQFLGWEDYNQNYLYFGSSAASTDYQWNISLSGGYSVITNANTPSRFLEYNASAPRFACYLSKSNQESVYLYRKDGSEGSSAVEQTSVTTVSATGVTGYNATLNGSFANASASPREAGFKWGLSKDNLQYFAQCSSAPSGTSGSFSATVDNLSDGITYWYRAYIIVWENGKGTYYYGETRSFRTSSETSHGYQWFELPQMNLQEVTIGSNTYLTNKSNTEVEYYAYHLCAGGEKGPNGKTARNYTVCFSAEHHCPLWVAAPRHSMYTGSSGRTDAYKADASIPASIQYNSKSTGGGCNKGHMLGSAERTSSKATNQQVFFYSNIAPQLSLGFNTGGGGWNLLEDFIDELVPSSQKDTLYEVVGCIFGTVTDGYGYKVTSKKISFGGRNDVSFPAAFYYAVLKKKNSSTQDSVAGCDANQLQCVAFVRAHTNSLKGQKPSAKELMSISDLERLTGITFFANVRNAPKSTYNASDWGL